MSRTHSGSVMPFVCTSVIFFMSVMGIAIDMMLDFQAVNQLEYAAQTAALYGMSLTTPADSSTYTTTSAQSRIQNAIINNTALWNLAPSGPKNKQDVVSFTASDVSFVPNAAEASGSNQEFFLQVTGRRAGQTALTQLFTPLVYTNLKAVGVPASLTAFAPFRTVEVVGQPASRIGPGAPLDTQANTRAADFVRFAAFPLALNYNQFTLHSQPGLPAGSYQLDLVNAFAGQVQANHIQACFLDLSPSSVTSTGFGNATNPTNLQNLLGYFALDTSHNLPPAAVERGNALNIYSLKQVSQPAVVQELSKTLSANRNFVFMLPVLKNNTVVGFARVLLAGGTGTTSGVPNMTVTFAPALACRNASCATIASNSTTPGSLLPAPIAPFTPRAADLETNNLPARAPGVVLAPAVSPRVLPPPLDHPQF